jgi:hypothetical protein
MNLPSLSPRWRLALRIFAVLFVVVTIVGFFVVPPIVKSQLEQRVTEALGRTTTVGAVKFNPYTLGLTLERLDIQRLDKTGSFAGWDRLYVNFDLLASLGGTVSLHAVELDGFHVTASIEQDGNFNFADILAKLAAPPAEAKKAAPAAPAKPFALHLGRLAVANARVDFADRSRARPFATVLGPVSFTLTEFRTVTERGAPFHFAAVTEAGEKFEWTGSLVAAPFSSKGRVVLEQINLPKYAAYYADRFGAELTGGRLSFRTDYEVALSDKLHTARLANGAVQLRGLTLAERATNETVLDLPALDVTGLAFDAVKLTGRIDAVRLTGGTVSARRDADGTINWLSFLPPAAPVPAPVAASAPTSTPAPDVTIGEFAVEKLAFGFEDRAAPRPAKLALGAVSVSVKNISLADGAVLPVQLGFDWAPRGHVSVAGTVALKPTVRAELQLDVADFAVLPLSPYLEQQLNARLAQGAVSTKQQITLALPAGGAPVVEVAGSLRVDQLGLVDGAAQEELAGFASLALNGLKVATAPQLKVSLEEIALAGPYARVVVREDKALNLAGLARPAPAASAPSPASAPAPAAAAAAEAPASAPDISIGRVTIDGGNFSFTDRSLAPQVRVALEKFGGTIGALSSKNLARAAVDLRGAVDGVGPVAVTGQLDPLGTPRFVDLKVDIKNVDLVPLSPYSGKYAGYELARGKFALDVKARIEGDRLQSDNVITLQQFTFGAPVESPDATKLPVRLGVALLKDIDGKIVIDVPMSGDVNDPNLRISKVVWRVVGNLLTKAAVSPFALIGSMFGGGDDLAFQQFEPGSAELREQARGKLDTMVKALTNRPGLSLGIDGAFDGPADTFALKRVKLDALVRGQIWEERRVTDPNLPPPDRLEITPEARVAKLKQLFDAKFPPGTQFGTPLPAAPAVVEPPAPPAGFFKRVVRVVTFAGRREKKAAAEANQKLATEHAAAVAAAQAAGVPLEEMTARLAETMEVTPDDLRALADARAARVRDYLINDGKIAADRLFLTKSPAPKAGAENRGPRVFLTLQ